MVSVLLPLLAALVHDPVFVSRIQIDKSLALPDSSTNVNMVHVLLQDLRREVGSCCRLVGSDLVPAAVKRFHMKFQARCLKKGLQVFAILQD